MSASSAERPSARNIAETASGTSEGDNRRSLAERIPGLQNNPDDDVVAHFGGHRRQTSLRGCKPQVLPQAFTRGAGDFGKSPRAAHRQRAPCGIAQGLFDEDQAAGRDPFQRIVDRDLSRLDKPVERLRQFLRDRGVQVIESTEVTIEGPLRYARINVTSSTVTASIARTE